MTRAVRIIQGDALARLRAMPSESVQCCVTSPPYWGLRDYGAAGQLGMEPSLDAHIAALVRVFDEVRRVLRSDGTLWLNYGDCYATTPNGRSAAETKAAGGDDRTFRDKPFSTIGGVFKPKDLLMAGNRLAIALQESGWYVRSEIVWAKPNPIPESIKDRPASAHEKVWMLARSERYYYDAASIKEPVTSDRSASRKAKGTGAGHASLRPGGAPYDGAGAERNARNVWTIASQPYRDAHFATMPVALAERCVKAGSPEGGVVLDPFGGAGTTAIAAIKNDRRAILVELSAKYCALARKRLASARRSA